MGEAERGRVRGSGCRVPGGIEGGLILSVFICVHLWFRFLSVPCRSSACRHARPTLWFLLFRVFSVLSVSPWLVSFRAPSGVQMASDALEKVNLLMRRAGARARPRGAEGINIQCSTRNAQ